MTISDTVKHLHKAESINIKEAMANLQQLQLNLKMAIEDGIPVEVNKILGMMQEINNKAMWSYAFTSGLRYATTE
jgi:uncharacterized protein (DUF849 family)